MRVTTQMVNESARKAGLPIHNQSLLNYINGNNSGSDLISALNQKTGLVNTEIKSNYEELEKAADYLQQKAEIFMAEGEESLFAKARESGNYQEIYDALEAMLDSYNATLKVLRTASGSLNAYYCLTLKEAAAENSEALEKIGITFSKDGTAAIDQDKLMAADPDALEEILGASGSFASKVAFVAGRIADNAAANLQSLSSLYGSDGSLYSALNNQYDFKG